jgi:VWFA-related protein
MIRPRLAASLASAIAAGCFTLSLSARQEAGTSDQIFRSHSDLVLLHVNVFDGRSDAVPDLPREAFSIIEDGRPQEIAFFNGADVPVSVGLVVDNSGSMLTRQQMVIAGGAAFVEASHPEDELFSVVFNENIRFGLPATVAFTQNPVQLRASLGRFRPGGKTALYDAVVAALDHLEDARHQKRALIVLSDGEDNASRVDANVMLDKARRSDAIIYTVSSASAGVTGGDGDGRILRKLADTSGGVAYFPRSDAQVIRTFAAIAGNIRRGYAIGYVPSNVSHDGGFRRVQVRVRVAGRNNLTVRARDGYLASDHPGTR